MPANHTADSAQRLGQAVRDHRAAHDLSQEDVKDAGGPSEAWLTKIENGRLETLTRLTARRLDKGLGWAEGTARRIWDGGERLTAGELDTLRDLIGANVVDEALRGRLLEVIEEQERGAS